MALQSLLTTTLQGNLGLLQMILGDLTDADLLIRPAAGANCIAWQLGHLIQSETRMQSLIPAAVPTALPPDWGLRHSNETASREPASVGFPSKADYLDLYQRVRADTLALLGQRSDSDLDQPLPVNPMPHLFSTVGSVFLMASQHLMMHIGQFSVVRRQLGKPVLF